MIRADGPWFKDEHGRTLILHGVNLGGSNKVPFRPSGATYIREGFYDHRHVSFVGRPFPLDQADEHFARLRAWGLTFLRLLVTWEAIEHAGPGIYDQPYLDYLYEIVRKAGEHGLHVFIDPHQDVWSRFSGGDGAPGWTCEAVGMDLTRLSEAGTAIVHAIHGDPFPRMIWPSNYTKLAAATMFTLFFGGSTFAPRATVDGEPVQEFLQRHYLQAIQQLVVRLKGLPQVVGYDTMNEPSPGFIGWTDLHDSGALKIGDSPSPFQAMVLGAGIPQEVGRYELGLTGAKLRQKRWLNPGGVRIWRDGRDCVWRENGVWDVGADNRPRLLRPTHFVQVDGRPVDFVEDHLRPFLHRYVEAVRSVTPDALVFLEGVPGGQHPRWGMQDPSRVVNAAHWYDGLTLYTKDYRAYLAVDFFTRKLVLGPWQVRRSLVRQLRRLRDEGLERMGGIPTVIGEVGIPFDMRNKAAYRTGDFSLQTQAMDASLRALDANLLSYTLWNYTADNDNQHGDQWNDEDFSIFSRDQQTNPADVNSGGRALQSVVRPYARAVAGEPLHMSFDRSKRLFRFEFRHDPALQEPTEVFVPRVQYPKGCSVEVSDGTYELQAKDQILTYRHAPGQDVHRITIRPR